MKIFELKNAPQWLLEASTENANIEWDSDFHNYIVWRGGVWRGGGEGGEAMKKRLQCFTRRCWKWFIEIVLYTPLDERIP